MPHYLVISTKIPQLAQSATPTSKRSLKILLIRTSMIGPYVPKIAL